MAPSIQDIRDFLTSRMAPGLLGDETVQKQIDIAQLLVDNVKSDDLSIADENTIVTGVAGYYSYLAYTTEMETARGELPQSVWYHMNALEKLHDRLLEIAALSSATGYLGTEGLTGTQRSELHEDRISGDLPEGETI